MYYRLVVIAALLSSCTGESSVPGSPEKVLAFEGEDVILPCSFTASNDFPTVEWSKEGLKPNVTFLYRDGCETYEMKNPAFEYRTSLIMKELKNGNISLRISNVQQSDAGRYQCMRLWRDAPWDITAVELIVCAASEPKLSVVLAESGGVTLQCEMNCSLPEPEIMFLDDQGNELPAEDPKREQDASGCYTVRRRMTLQTVTNSVTCRVQQPEFNHSRDTQILILADCMRSCILIIIIAVGGIILLLVIGCGLVIWLWKRCSKSEGAQKLPVTRQASDQNAVSGTSENQSLLKQINMADNVINSTIEKLEKEMAHLKSKLHERDGAISRLQNKLKSQLSPVCQHKQPTIVCSVSKSSLDVSKPISLENSILTKDHIPKPTVSTNDNPPKPAKLSQNKGPKPGIQRQNSNPVSKHPIQRKQRRNSSPARFTYNEAVSSSSSGSTSKKNPRKLCRSMSESYAQPEPNHAKLERRHSLGISSTLSTKRYTVLAHVKEEFEPLM